MLGDHGDAEDAAQEAFLKAYRALNRYDIKRSFSTWLLAVTAHHCIDKLRRRRLSVVSLEALPPWRWVPVETVDPERHVEMSDRADEVTGLLQTLPDDYRLVLVLRYWHDLGYAEIAELTGDTVSAVKSRLHRARRQLALQLGPEYERGDGQKAGAGYDGASEAAAEGEKLECTAMMPAS
jgi:RNA polymerase sigma-70 factor (ECF subfamily)